MRRLQQILQENAAKANNEPPKGVDDPQFVDGDSGTFIDEDGKEDRFRANSYNTYEKQGNPRRVDGTPNADLGHQAVEEVIADGGSVSTDGGRGNFGRLLAVVKDSTGRDIGPDMVASGLAAPTRGRESAQAEMAGIAREALGYDRSGNKRFNELAKQKVDVDPMANAKIDTRYYDRRGTFHKAWDRGNDQTKQALGGVINYLGDIFENEGFKQTGREMSEDASLDIQLNPREVENFTKANTMDKKIDYIVETFGELAPGLIFDAALTVGTGGAGAGAALARRAGMEGIKRGIKRGVITGAAAGGFIEGLGDMNARLEEKGIDDTFAPLMAGAATAITDAAPVGLVFGDLMKAAGLDKKVIKEVTKRLDRPKTAERIKKVVGQSIKGSLKAGLSEGAAEGVQGIINDVIYANAADEEWSIDTIQSLDDMLRGVLGGGAMGGGAIAATSTIQQYNEARDGIDKQGNLTNKEGWQINDDGSIKTEEKEYEPQELEETKLDDKTMQSLQWALDKGPKGDKSDKEYWGADEERVSTVPDPDKRRHWERIETEHADVPNLNKKDRARVEAALIPEGKPVSLKELQNLLEQGTLTEQDVVQYLADDRYGQANSIYSDFEKETAERLRAEAVKMIDDRISDNTLKLDKETAALVPKALEGDAEAQKAVVKAASPALHQVINKRAVKFDVKKMWQEFRNPSQDTSADNVKTEKETPAEKIESEANEFKEAQAAAEAQGKTKPKINDPSIASPSIPKLNLLDESEGENTEGAGAAPLDFADRLKKTASKVKRAQRVLTSAVQVAADDAELRKVKADQLYLDVAEKAESFEDLEQLVNSRKNAVSRDEKRAALKIVKRQLDAGNSFEAAKDQFLNDVVDQIMHDRGQDKSPTKNKEKRKEPSTKEQRIQKWAAEQVKEGDPDISAAIKLINHAKTPSNVRKNAQEYINRRFNEFSDEEAKLEAEFTYIDEDGEEKTIGDVQATEDEGVLQSPLDTDLSERQRIAAQTGFVQQTRDLFNQLAKVTGNTRLEPLLAHLMKKHAGNGWQAIGKNAAGKNTPTALHPLKLMTEDEGVNRGSYGNRPTRVFKRSSVDKLARLLNKNELNEAEQYLADLGVFLPGHIVGDMPKVDSAVRLKLLAEDTAFLLRSKTITARQTIEATKGGKTVRFNLPQMVNSNLGELDSADVDFHDENFTKKVMEAVHDAIADIVSSDYELDIRGIPKNKILFVDHSSANKKTQRMTYNDLLKARANSIKGKHSIQDADDSTRRHEDYDEFSATEYGAHYGDVFDKDDYDDADFIASKEESVYWSSIDQIEKRSGFHAEGEGSSELGSAVLSSKSKIESGQTNKREKREALSKEVEALEQNEIQRTVAEVEGRIAAETEKLKALRALGRKLKEAAKSKKSVNLHVETRPSGLKVPRAVEAPKTREQRQKLTEEIRQNIMAVDQLRKTIKEDKAALESYKKQFDVAEPAKAKKSKEQLEAEKLVVEHHKTIKIFEGNLTAAEKELADAKTAHKSSRDPAKTKHAVDNARKTVEKAKAALANEQKAAEAKAQAVRAEFFGPSIAAKDPRAKPKERRLVTPKQVADYLENFVGPHPQPRKFKEKQLVRVIRRKRGAARALFASVIRSIESRVRNIHPDAADGYRQYTLDKAGMAEDFVAEAAKVIGDEKAQQKGYEDLVNGRDTPKAKAYQAWLDYVEQWVREVDPSYKRGDGPLLSLNTEAIDKNRKGFMEIVKKSKVKDPIGFVEKIFEGNGVAEWAQTMETGNPSHSRTNALQSVRKELEEAGFLDRDAPRHISHYAHAASSYVSWQKKVKPNLQKWMDEIHPSNLDEFKKLTDGITGKNALGLHPLWQGFNSVTLAFQTATVLLFSAVASIPELGGIVARNRRFTDSLGKDFDDIVNGMSLAEKKQFALDYNIIGGEVVQHTLQNMYAMDSLTVGRFAQSVQNAMFKFNGQQFLTQFNRTLAATTGKRFLEHHAKKNDATSKRMLAELGIDAETVLKHIKNNDITKPEGRAYKMALHRFVNEAVTNPRANQLPLIATDPRFAVLTSLKKFFYGFYHNVNKGLMANARHSKSEGVSKEAYMAMVMTGVTMLPLAALAELLREKIKYPLGRPAWQDKKSTGDLIAEMVLATGAFGPLHMAQLPYEMNQYGKNSAVVFAGPTVGYAYDAVKGDLTFSRHIPVVNQIPGLAKEVNRVGREAFK